MPESLDIWKLLAGLGIFLFGMFLMEESIKNLAGRSFKGFIRNSTKGILRSVASGTLVTGILQSSSAVSLMVLAFVGAGIMAMENAIGVILGSNLGTTVTAWIVAFFGFKVNIEDYSLPLIGLGGLGLIFLGKSVRYSNISKLLVGFGFLFMGLDYMKTSVEAMTQSFDVSSLPDYGILP
jgi:phosphate:Na+ symporter